MSDFKAFLSQKLDMVCHLFTKDMEALSHEQLGQSSGGCARTGYDIAFEIVTTNRLFAKIVRGGEMEPFKFEGWLVAPDDFKDKESALAEVRASFMEMKDSLLACPDDEINVTTDTPIGPKSRADIAFMSVYHGGYHSGQLNYIQTLNGDGDMHWM